MLDENSAMPLYKQLKDILQKKIYSGEWALQYSGQTHRNLSMYGMTEITNFMSSLQISCLN
jgi:DNA-binding GntR family transcriptional regulator